MSEKPSVLFVDDERSVLDGLRRMLHAMRSSWEMRFCDSGAAAIACMEEFTSDVIVTDVRMPEMSGVELLTIVKDRWPRAVRIVLSGHADREDIVVGVAPIHQFLQKPCSSDVLRATIHRVLALRDLLDCDAMRSAVARIEALPSLPETYHQLTATLRNELATVSDVAEIIGRDLAMTAKLLQLVNSSFFGSCRHIATVKDAVVLLGLGLVRALALTARIFETVLSDASPKAHQCAKDAFCESLTIGRAARQCAIELGADHRVADLAQLAGTLSIVGKLVLAMLEYGCAADGQPSEPLDCHPNYAHVGAYLLGLWGYDDVLVDAVAFHRTPSMSLQANPIVLAAVHLAHSRTGKEPAQPDEAFLVRACGGSAAVSAV